ncbi:hypothetical protein MNAB215_4229 [Mycobacterium numidiamassiliense]|uniref:Uncharacterized protein n=1 Tax=Mycobacterium numidiamassiliense TaxID=1841861 RepID=A0A2U3PE33_9MYCO|nr:hypothetical protein MNAB215_4229 [Mycobacterium numidiamassiliense]
MNQAVRVAPVALVDLAVPVPVDLADPVLVDRAVPVDPVSTRAAPVDPVDLAVPVPVDLAVRDTPADLAVLAARVDPVDRVVLGTVTPNAVTSTALRGATDLRPGDRVSLRDRRGIDRCRRPEAHGTTARSTTGATRRTRSGTLDSTSGASTSSESGSRCKHSATTTPASPLGEAGVVLSP